VPVQDVLGGGERGDSKQQDGEEKKKTERRRRKKKGVVGPPPLLLLPGPPCPAPGQGRGMENTIHRLNRTLFGPRRVGGRWAAVPSTVVDETSMGHGCGFLAL